MRKMKADSLADLVTMAARLHVARAPAPNLPDLLITGLLGTSASLTQLKADCHSFFHAVTRVQIPSGRHFRTSNFQPFAQKLIGTKRHRFRSNSPFGLAAGFLSSLCIRKKLSNDRCLSRSLCRGYSLRIRVECHTRGRMPKQFLHDLYVCSTCLKQR